MLEGLSTAGSVRHSTCYGVAIPFVKPGKTRENSPKPGDFRVRKSGMIQ